MFSQNSILYSGLFSWGANFPGFPEWAHDLEKFILDFRRLDCGIEILCTQQLQTDREYCVALVHKQALRLLPASRRTNRRFYTDGTHPALARTKASHVRFSVRLWSSKSGKFLLKLKFTNWENLHLGKITRYTVAIPSKLCMIILQKLFTICCRIYRINHWNYGPEIFFQTLI